MIFVVDDELLVKILYRNLCYVLIEHIVFLVLYCEFMLESFRYDINYF